MKGQVIDESGAPIIGATITIKDKFGGTLTDIDGNFTLETKADDLLIFSFIGFHQEAILASEIGDSAKIIMKEDSIELSCYIIVDPLPSPARITESINSGEQEIRGTIIEENGEPIIGVTIAIKGSNKGTISDIDGHFSIEAKENDKLSFSCVGYKTQNITVSSLQNQNVPIVLETDDIILCYEVVAVPYSYPDDIYDSSSKSIDKLSYDEIEVKPVSPVGDLESFEKWVQSNIQYSEQMKKDKIEGEVILSFAIDKKGKLVDKKVIGKLSKEADKEALRVLSLSEPWKAGIHYDDRPIKTTMIINIKFDCN